MEIKNEFGASRVVVLNVGQEDVDGLLINWDLNDAGEIEYMEKSFIDVVTSYLPEYSMGYDSKGISQSSIVPLLREAAEGVIKIKKIDTIRDYLNQGIPYDQWDQEVQEFYNSKGVFSELILHFLLRDMKETLPLISKIYFKDSRAVEAHGFDAVHVTDNTLWLEETKFYMDGKDGIKKLISDLNNHFNHNYLKEQFVIISRALVHNDTLRESWIQKITNANRLEEIFSFIKIPLLCIYEDPVSDTILDELNKGGCAETIYFDHISELKRYFDSKNTFPNKNKVECILMLLPVQSKNRIVSAMLARIHNMQHI